MLVYLCGFSTSIILFAISEKFVKKQRWIFVLPALVIPCLIAGFRAATVGVDTEGYLVPMIKAAFAAKNYTTYMHSSWFRIWRNLIVEDYEIGFSFIIYIIAKVFHSIIAVQFIVQLLTIVPVYLAVSRTKYKTWICMSVYYFVFFNTSLNMIRQMMAVAIGLFAIQFLMEGKKKYFICFSIISFLFHYSAVLILLIAFIYMFVQKESKRKIVGINIKPYYSNMILVIFISVISLIGLNVVVKILPYIGLGRYVNYLMGSSGGIRFMSMQIVTRLPILVLFIINWKVMKEKEGNLRFYFTMLSLDIILSQLSSVNMYSGRITVYFSVFGIFSYSSLCSNAKYKNITKICVLTYTIFYWWYFYVFLGRDSTIPYSII